MTPPSSQVNLNILTWNIRSIFTVDIHGHKMLKTMIWDVYNNFLNHDIICIPEMWCEDSEDHMLEDEKFKVFYSDGKVRHGNAKRPSGGVAL